jgi:hypothetical protein
VWRDRPQAYCRDLLKFCRDRGNQTTAPLQQRGRAHARAYIYAPAFVMNPAVKKFELVIIVTLIAITALLALSFVIS